MRLYYRPLSARPVRVAWLLEELGAPYEPISVSTEETRKPEHLARHPLGHVPVLETDGEVMFESTAICLHLADQHPQAGLIGPIGSFDRAVVYQWTLFAMTELEPAVVEFAQHSHSDHDRAVSGADRFRAGAAVIERTLEGREFLVGERLTVADIVTGAVLGGATRRRLLPAADLSSVSVYVDRLIARPAFARAVVATESNLAELMQPDAPAGE
jgi:glutathione S-transferase